jgi:2-polyprenyl-3-methyl-5-hydroxy-6-metoxy-1,4-benzoquinol methylase
VTAGLDARARQSLGTSEDAIHAAVAAAFDARGASGVLADVGCGTGNLWRAVHHRFSRYVAVDAVRYEGLPAEADFRPADLDRARLPLQDGEADVAAAVETIEHLENPRAFIRELSRVVRPGGLVVVTTPNQRSFLSLATLVIKGRFSAFQDNAYPAHLTALLDVDMRRIAAECRLEDVAISYTLRGRMPLSAAHYPRAVAGMFPRGLSDNLVLAARTPEAA